MKKSIGVKLISFKRPVNTTAPYPGDSGLKYVKKLKKFYPATREELIDLLSKAAVDKHRTYPASWIYDLIADLKVTYYVWPRTKILRYQTIVAMRSCGLSFKKIGQEIGLSAERVRQLSQVANFAEIGDYYNIPLIQAKIFCRLGVITLLPSEP